MRGGNVPTSRIGPILADMIAQRWPHCDEDGCNVLAEKVGCDESAIRTIIDQKHQGVSFDLADSLLCALGRADMWWGVLSDVYPTKFVEKCALHSCERTFPEKRVGSIKRYCSARCRKLDDDIRRGRATGHRYRQKNRCLRGHLLTSENTITFSSGHRTCRKCRRDRQARQYRERYANDPVFAEKQRARSRKAVT